MNARPEKVVYRSWPLLAVKSKGWDPSVVRLDWLIGSVPFLCHRSVFPLYPAIVVAERQITINLTKGALGVMSVVSYFKIGVICYVMCP